MRNRVEYAAAGMRYVELNRTGRILEKWFAVLVLPESNESRIGIRVLRQQATQGSTSQDESDPIVIEMEPICPVPLFLVENGQMMIERNRGVRDGHIPEVDCPYRQFSGQQLKGWFWG
jgi:hypothetical protein